MRCFQGAPALRSGNADIANISSNWIGKARKSGLVQILDYNDWRKQQGLPTNEAQNLGWGTSLKMLKQHPDTVRAFLRANPGCGRADPLARTCYDGDLVLQPVVPHCAHLLAVSVVPV